MNIADIAMKNGNYLLSLVLAAVLLSGCASVDYTKHEKGAFWCNEPLKLSDGVHFDERHLNAARRGYLYALAAAWVLQTTNPEGADHWFNLPARIKPSEGLPRHHSGFEVRTFEVKEDPSDPVLSEVVVAFTGSNDRDDWLFTNFLFSQRQYELAREYVKQVAQKYPGIRLVVTGVSLGGALAGHVTKREETRDYIAEAWLLNPSPKLYANDQVDQRIWVLAMRGEILHAVRTPFMETIWPGINRIGAPWYQTADDFYQVKSSVVYAHFRWLIARNVLFVADYAHLQHKLGPVDPRRVNEPREILEASCFRACAKEKEWQQIVEGRNAGIPYEEIKIVPWACMKPSQ
ncbi:MULTISPECIES: hypothetical protein [Massilia]|uniref:Alpha/beta hydrolase n=1 Tax=Massilia haematophila TaxID=457923 RepID=A0ABV7PFX0_9BURK|nr:hypothetical protein [Massilia sp.]